MKNRTTIYMEKDLIKEAKQFAIEREVSFSKLVEDAVANCIECDKHDIDITGRYPVGGFKHESIH